jgi:Putative DNA-binding domain
MRTLAEAQDNFVETINCGPDRLDPKLFAGAEERILLGLKAHANTISHARLVALEDSFPLTLAHLGDAAFNALCRDYCETADARQSDSNQMGAGLARFMAAHNLPATVLDLAQIEWAWLESYHAPDASALMLGEIAAMPQAQMLDMAICWHPATRVIPVTGALSTQLAELTADQPAAIIVLRPDAEVRLLALDAATTDIALACKKSTSIGNLLALAAEMAAVADPSGPVVTLIGAGALVEAGAQDVSKADPIL